MHYVSGLLWTADGFRSGHIGFEEGVIKEVGEGEIERSEARGYILPTFINAHTHLADFGAKVDPTLPLEDLVAPPHGLKHRYLEQASDEEIARSFSHLSRRMFRSGTSNFLDFREGGVEGAKILTSFRKVKWARAVVMGRPLGLHYDKSEVDELLRWVDGIGISSISDWPYEELRALAEHARSKKKRFALHASERVREDIDLVLDLRPSYLVHMTEASDGDLEKCQEAQVPVVVCPRSNLFFGKVPPLARMMRAGVTLALGTDNAMIALPNMLAEMEFAGRILRSQGHTDLLGVLDMAVRNGRLILNEKDSISMEPGSPCDFMVIRSKGSDPFTDLVLRSSERDVRLVCSGEDSWRGWR